MTSNNINKLVQDLLNINLNDHDMLTRFLETIQMKQNTNRYFYIGYKNALLNHIENWLTTRIFELQARQEHLDKYFSSFENDSNSIATDELPENQSDALSSNHTD